ncbi:hypothetical protein cgp_0392 [Corynebacterium glutamicum MB001]|nr:hypothetical protein cgp_0392 [Corynebacterium glutamicum MB001]ASW13111.1 hypothetical protein cgc1_0392 [Corynebacterium glutamicum]QYO72570.1 hypothetical protein cgisf_0392 [Corynebacterium glutamicum]
METWWVFAFSALKNARIHHRSQDTSGMWWILALEAHSYPEGIDGAR